MFSRFAVLALCVAGAFATVGNLDIYSKLVDTSVVPIGATLNPTDTHRDCMISPSVNSFPTQTVHAATVSVLAGYTVTYNGASTLKMCCAFYGHLDLTVGSQTNGHCLNNVCSISSFDELAFDGANGDPLGTFTAKDYGTNYYLSTNSVLNNLCFPVNQCYIVDANISPALKTYAAVTSEPWQHTGSGYNDGDNYFSRISQPTSVIDPSLPNGSPFPFVNTVRNAWIQFPADYSVNINNAAVDVNGNEIDYVIPQGIYSAYEIWVSAATVCHTPPASGTCTTTNANKKTKFSCRDRGAADSNGCYLPCGYTYVNNYIKDISTTHSDSLDSTIAVTVCYANCVAHA